jgi:Ca2+-transporting ATPase
LPPDSAAHDDEAEPTGNVTPENRQPLNVPDRNAECARRSLAVHRLPLSWTGVRVSERLENPWHAWSPSDVLLALGSRPAGLGDDEASRRLASYGPNRMARAAGPSGWHILAAQFRSVVTLLLIGASVLSVLLGDYADAVAIGIVVTLNAGIGFVIEVRARRAMDSLLDLQAGRAVVVRDGHVRTIDAAGAVPGDVLDLTAGQAVPADGRLLSETELRTIEAALTGESLPVSKSAGLELPQDTELAERQNMVYQGTVIAAGTGRAVVTATAGLTEVGRIAALTRAVHQSSTPLERRLDALGRRLAWLALGAAGFVTILGAMHGQPWAVMIQTGIALAVAAVPEGLPAVVTIALAIGLHRMARRRALVRRLPAVEALGAATVVCTDKTRTLTSGDMRVVRIFSHGRKFCMESDLVSGMPPDPRLSHALEVAARASRPQPASGDRGHGVSSDPVDAAMLHAAQAGGFVMEETSGAPAALIPFSSDRGFMASFHQRGDRLVAYVKGAPHRVLEMCRAGTDRDVPDINTLMAADGLRVIALASGPVEAATESALENLEFEGLVGLMDPPAPGVKDAVARLGGAGIRTIMLTGDQRATAEAVGRDLGVHTVFSRVTPAEKLTIVAGLQQKGEIVAMIGDGINDAPALRQADIGVAMGGRGTAVAQDAAAVVLQDDRFETIVAAVEEGRVIFDNIRKVVFYLFSCNLGEVLVLVVAGLFGLPLPLLPLQILWTNLVTDTFPALALALEPGEPGVMARPPRNPQVAILSRPFLWRVLLYAGLIAASTLAAFLWGLAHAPAVATTMAFMTLTLTQILHLGNARSSRSVLSPAAALSNRYAVAALGLSLALQFATALIDPLAATLGVLALTPAQWFVVLVYSAATALVGQALRVWRPS